MLEEAINLAVSKLPRWSNLSRKAKVLGAALATLLTSYVGYKHNGAEELRAQLYQPLYTDFVVIQEALQTVSTDRPPVMKAIEELKRTGALSRLPTHLRDRILKVSTEVGNFHGAILPVRELVVREASATISHIRTPSMASEDCRDSSPEG